MKIATTKHFFIFYSIVILSVLITIVDTAHLSTSSSFTSNYQMMKSHHKSANRNKVQSTPSLTGSKVIYQAWVQYFKYQKNSNSIPQNFFKNPSYSRQVLFGNSKLKAGKTKEQSSDEFGSLSIPSNTHFFLVLFKDRVNFLESRTNALTSTFDSLPIDFIQIIPSDNISNGGVTDKGKFNEGYCFQIHTTKPEKFSKTIDKSNPGIKEEWLICLDSENAKNTLMQKIINEKLKQQKEKGIVTVPTTEGEKEPIDEELNPNVGPNDGYWILLQDWTQCSVKCGGGKQYKQLMCVPPKPNGKACQGEPIRTKDCNPQPCPAIKTLENVLNSNNKTKDANIFEENNGEKPEIKMMPISTRPQRYDRCVIMDWDALIVDNNNDGQSNEKMPNIPIRLVMNTKSIIAYIDQDYKNPYKVFNLESIKLLRKEASKSCFVLQDLHQQAQICQLDCINQDSSFVELWEKEIHIFKNWCSNSKREVVELKNNQEWNEKINDLKSEYLKVQKEQIKKQTVQSELSESSKTIEETKSMTLMAVQKEKKLEELLEKEETEREAQEIEDLKIQWEAEKKKSGCWMESLKEKELEDMYTVGKSETEEKVEELKEKAKQEINLLREKTKKKIAVQRWINQRKISDMKTKIKLLRLETVNKLQSIAKDGNMDNCFIGTTNRFSEIEQYCGVAYLDEPNKYVDCKNMDTFCYSCCENEFGAAHPAKRDLCYKKKCNPDNAKPENTHPEGSN